MLFIVIFLACFIVLVLLFLFAIQVLLPVIFWYGVPYVPTPDYKITKLCESLKLRSGNIFYDIGCGDGKVVEAVKKQFPAVTCIWIENSFHPYFLAKRRQKESGVSYDVRRANFFSTDISEADVVYCYLLPLHMKRVYNKVCRECRPGALLYSSSFEVPWVDYYEKIHVRDNKYFYVYRV